MPVIRPISDLRNRAHEISELCHQTGEPVFITKSGRDDLVVMSVAAWEREQSRLALYGLLDEAAEEVRRGDRGIGVKALRSRLRR